MSPVSDRRAVDPGRAAPPLALLAGPCVLEGESHALALGGAGRDVPRRCGVPFIFKASFDKANRTSGASYRGPGVDEGLRVLGEGGRQLDVPGLTDIHEPRQG